MIVIIVDKEIRPFLPQEVKHGAMERKGVADNFSRQGKGAIAANVFVMQPLLVSRKPTV